ncbi:N-acetylglucosamine-6-phosphate deacetylase [Pseudomarimonas arenosa]|uniref:N-acetylglucosamine-6-phosphate deacetylase n=1 Tax=Pseudomarimonas arenosa TaxID=2774145 RepID=A0AAW3ZG74_9GAMM|nr:N-acetylglucosamine-6-phosphate deacetylase [Pseudomarimonas arenosa]MBD8524858.1 N-acetylglucosamine-6-phosphate deacetylase [Pseudomarimonas arenosa]
MRLALHNGSILTPTGWVEDRVLLIDDERIEALVVEDDPRCAQAELIDLRRQRLLPGFIDIQVNGGGGALFNDEPSVDTIRRIGAAHRRFGTTGFLPTLISDDRETIQRAVDAVSAAIAAGVPGVLGVHIEGPCLNRQRKGTHDAAKFRDLDDQDIAVLGSLRGGCILLTLAPEMTRVSTIARLRETGVIVSAGHSNASYADMRRALDHGVSAVTHLFNAMSPLTSREPGVVGAALDDPTCWCSIIVDGVHVDPVVLRIALAARQQQRFILISDAMPNVGSDQPYFLLQGRRIEQTNGRLLDPDGVLSGSSLDMASAVRNAHRWLDLPLQQAVHMASAAPAEFLGLSESTGSIRPGLRADLVLVDQQVQVLRTWIGGREG